MFLTRGSLEQLEHFANILRSGYLKPCSQNVPKAHKMFVTPQIVPNMFAMSITHRNYRTKVAMCAMGASLWIAPKKKQWSWGYWRFLVWLECQSPGPMRTNLGTPAGFEQSPRSGPGRRPVTGQGTGRPGRGKLGTMCEIRAIFWNHWKINSLIRTGMCASQLWK